MKEIDGRDKLLFREVIEKLAIEPSWIRLFERLGKRWGFLFVSMRLLGVLPLVYSQSRRVRVAPFVFQLRTRVEIQPNQEVADTFWLALSDIANNVITKAKVQVENGNRVTDSYIYRGNVIWGLTFRIINILLDKNVDGRVSH